MCRRRRRRRRLHEQVMLARRRPKLLCVRETNTNSRRKMADGHRCSPMTASTSAVRRAIYRLPANVSRAFVHQFEIIHRPAFFLFLLALKSYPAIVSPVPRTRDFLSEEEWARLGKSRIGVPKWLLNKCVSIIFKVLILPWDGGGPTFYFFETIKKNYQTKHYT